MSEIGESVSRWAGQIAASTCAAVHPRSAASSIGTLWATAEHAPTATRASVILPSATATKAATIVIEITRYLRAPILIKQPTPSPNCVGKAGTVIAVTIPPGCNAVWRTPSTKLVRGTDRTPDSDAISTAASSVSKGGTPSAAGEALHRLPANVATF